MTLWTVGPLVVAVLAFAVVQPIKVLPRIRLAPGFSLVDQSGAPLTSEDGRGTVTLYTFDYPGCGEPCREGEEIARSVRAGVAGVDLGGADFRIVTLSLDPAADLAGVATAARASGADGVAWRWARAEPDRLKDIVGRGFRVYFEPQADGSVDFDQSFVLVDGWGVVRGEYDYATLASTADKILRHVGVLGEELRNSTGAASLAYEAAHLFLCYP